MKGKKLILLGGILGTLAFGATEEELTNLEVPPIPDSFQAIDIKKTETPVQERRVINRYKISETSDDLLKFLNEVRRKLGLSTWSSLSDVYNNTYEKPAETAVTFSVARELREFKKYKVQLENLLSNMSLRGEIRKFLISKCLNENPTSSDYEIGAEECLDKPLKDLWNNYIGNSCFDPAEESLKTIGLSSNTVSAIINYIGSVKYCLNSSEIVEKEIKLTNPLKIYKDLKEAYEKNIDNYLSSLTDTNSITIDRSYKQNLGAGLYIDDDSFSEDRTYVVAPKWVVKKLKYLKDQADEKVYKSALDKLTSHLAYAQLIGAYKYADIMLSYASTVYYGFEKDFSTRIEKLGTWLDAMRKDIKETTGLASVQDAFGEIDKLETKEVSESRQLVTESFNKAAINQSPKAYELFGIKAVKSSALEGAKANTIKQIGDGTFVAIYESSYYQNSAFFMSAGLSSMCGSFIPEILYASGIEVPSDELSAISTLFCSVASILGGF